MQRQRRRRQRPDAAATAAGGGTHPSGTRWGHAPSPHPGPRAAPPTSSSPASAAPWSPGCAARRALQREAATVGGGFQARRRRAEVVAGGRGAPRSASSADCGVAPAAAGRPRAPGRAMGLLPTAAPRCTQTAAAMVPPLDGFRVQEGREGGRAGNVAAGSLPLGVGQCWVKAQQGGTAQRWIPPTHRAPSILHSVCEPLPRCPAARQSASAAGSFGTSLALQFGIIVFSNTPVGARHPASSTPQPNGATRLAGASPCGAHGALL